MTTSNDPTTSKAQTEPSHDHSHDDHEQHDHVHGPSCSHHHHQAQPYVRESAKVGRNDPCPCGSGGKFKKCCGKN